MNTNAYNLRQSVEFNFTRSIFVNGTHMIAHRNDTVVVVVSDNDYKDYFHNLIGRGITNTLPVQEVVVANSHFLLAKEMYEETDTPSRIRIMAERNKVMPPKDHHVTRITLLRSTLNAIGETPSLKECKAMVDLFYSGHTDPQRCYYRVTIGEHAMSDINIHKSPEQNTTSLPCITTPVVSPHDGAVVNATVYKPNTDNDNTPHYCNMPTLTQPQHLFAYLLDQIEHNSDYNQDVSFHLSSKDIKLLAKQVKVFVKDDSEIGGGRKLKGEEKQIVLIYMLNVNIGRREKTCNSLNRDSVITIGNEEYKITAK